MGDVIDLGQPKESPIYLEIGGYHWFTGKMGTHKKNMAVKIDEVCYVAAAPIIWFMTSQTALMVSSLSSNSSSGVSPPMRMSTMTLMKII